MKESLIENKVEGHERYAYIMRKLAAFTRAVYLITDLIDDREPLRWTLREMTLQTVELAHRQRMVGVAAGRASFHNLAERIADIFLLVSTGRDIGLISKMNAEVLCGELKSFADEIIAQKASWTSTSPVITSDMFSVTNEFGQQIMTENSHSMSESIYKGQENVLYHNSPRTGISEANSGTRNTSTPLYKSDDTATNKDINKIVSKQAAAHGHLATHQNNAGTPNYERRAKILAFLSKQRKAAIPDISKYVGNVSDKTIQRELQSLLLEGAIVREGDRRWARYSLKK